MSKYTPVILIVDDDPYSRESAEALLMKENYKLFFAENGFEAIEFTKKHDPDLILLDIMMPQMDGFEVCRKIREDETIAEVPIILVTALDDKDSKISGLEAGADDFISKPYDRLELRTRVRTITRLNRYRVLHDERDEKETITKQRDIIAIQKTELTDSIEYAKRIQTAVLTPLDYINKTLPNNFILFKPKAIVSGDFYWVTEKNGIKIIAVGDCTGHGVPGALMTMLGMSFLNEIISQNIELKPNIILDKLRTKIVQALNQPGKEEISRDGMDIALCMIDMKNMKLQFAGAINPLILIRNKDLQIIKADRMSVGMENREEVSFSDNNLDINIGDVLYMSTDGFQDQFGGSNRKKFTSTRLHELLLDIHKNEMDKQKEILDKTLTDWMNGDVQIDDILVLGIKI
jgi:phosphoserine phosphatase RsbU/P